MGQYVVTTKRSGTLQLLYVLVPVVGVDNQDKDKVKVYAVSTSYDPVSWRLNIITSEELTGSTLRLVKKDTSVTFLPLWPRGVAFLSMTAGVPDAIKANLPDATKDYILFACATTFPIAAGLAHIVKGAVDGSIMNELGNLSPLAIVWLQVVEILHI